MYRTITATAIIISLAASVATASLVTNGNFESKGSPSLTGWTTIGGGSGNNDGFPMAVNLNQSPYDIDPQTAAITTAAAFPTGGSSPFPTLEQTIKGLTGGKTYQITFDLALFDSSGKTDGFNASFDGKSLDSSDEVGSPTLVGGGTLGPQLPHSGKQTDFAWTSYTFDVTIGEKAKKALLKFAGRDGGGSYVLTDVNVELVPEPGTLIVWSLLGLGSACGMRVWRRRGSGIDIGGAGCQRWSPAARNAILEVVHLPSK